ncbi:major intrinsically disordered NOTCH2-binding receptor 1-like [Discoglossus pictus]
MDLSVLPNNNHPDKFLRLDVNTLTANSTALHVGRWHNRVYLQREKTTVNEHVHFSNEEVPVTADKVLGGHITPEMLRSTIKNNPLYMDVGRQQRKETNKKQPSWTIQDYECQSPNPKIAIYLQENPNDLQYWLEDIYTPGYDSLLKKKEREKKYSKYCKIFMFSSLACSILIAIIIVTYFFT